MRRRGRAPLGISGIDDGIQPGEPAVALFVTNRRHDEQVTRASRRHVQQANRFFDIAVMLFHLMLLEFARCASRELHRRQL